MVKVLDFLVLDLVGRALQHVLRVASHGLGTPGVSSEDRQTLLGHANHGMAGHYASADVGRLIKLANLVLKREGTCTVLRIANAARSDLCVKGPAEVRQT
jgi:hypothetical protein